MKPSVKTKARIRSHMLGVTDFYDLIFLPSEKHYPKHSIEKIEKYSTLELVDSFVERISSSRCFMYWKSKNGISSMF